MPVVVTVGLSVIKLDDKIGHGPGGDRRFWELTVTTNGVEVLNSWHSTLDDANKQLQVITKLVSKMDREYQSVTGLKMLSSSIISGVFIALLTAFIVVRLLS